MNRPYQMVPYALGTADRQRTLEFPFQRDRQGENRRLADASALKWRSRTIWCRLCSMRSCACWVQGPRSIGNDLRLEHETALFDVAAGMTHLRRGRATRRSSCSATPVAPGCTRFYNQQALTPREVRIARTPGGRPTNLGELHMPGG
ncbi:hypothetical protein ACTMU2_13545 [Cupriavidus basilensis]